MAGTQQKHRFIFDVLARNRRPVRERVVCRHHSHKFFVVEGLNHDARLINRERYDRSVKLTAFKLLKKVRGEAFRENKRHVGSHFVHAAHEIRNEVGGDCANRSQAQLPA